MSVYDTGIATILGLDLILAGIAIPLMRRRVPRNVWYGYRTRATLADDEIWYASNAHFGRGLLRACLASAAGILILRAAGVSPFVFPPAAAAILVIPLAIAIAATSRFVRRFAATASAAAASTARNGSMTRP